MPTLAVIKQQKLLTEHQIQDIETQVTELVRQGIEDGTPICINFEGFGGPQCTVNVLVEEADIERIKAVINEQGGT